MAENENATNNTESSITFVQRVINLFKEGDKSKIAKFQKRALKAIAKQIQTREESIETLNDQIEDLKENQAEAIINIDMECISDTDSIDRYIPTYISKQMSFINDVSSKEEEVKDLKAEVVTLNTLAKSIK